MKNRKLKTLLYCLIQGRIVESIQESNGWKNENEENIIYVIHCKIRNFFFDRAFHKLPIKYRIKLLSKFSHKRHFIEGVSKSFALEYYYLNRDAFEEDGMIRGLEGGSVNMTTEMRAYYHSIDETVLEIADNKALLKDLVYEVAKQLSNVFYERLELISKELSLSCDVNDEIYVAAPIPYKEYKFGNHSTVKCFEPEIAFGMEIYGVRDSLKPIDEYISDIKMFIDAFNKGFKEELQTIFVIANENTTRILDDKNLIIHFEECRRENQVFHMRSIFDDIKSIPSTINKELPNGVQSVEDAIKLWDLDLKSDYPFFWVIDTKTMEADFRNSEKDSKKRIKLHLSKEELLKINHQDKHQCENTKFICVADDDNAIEVLNLIWQFDCLELKPEYVDDEDKQKLIKEL
ncbi:hypothetical protein [Aliarcobacter butzleri]|uniref:hypothetical protein n=1 Tax=Aliarcobacter butzleri TaxID=28197 RepID=UPI00344CF094